jgi:hypothetical protein
MQVSLTHLPNESAALRISTPASDERTPSHFIALLDVSESMMDDNKLVNVKRCMSLLLKFLTPADELSVVSFGEDSKIILNRVKAEAGAVSMMEQAIESLQTNGCTNLSAGLGSVREILSADSGLKTGLLVLTDGHANRGAHTSGELHTIVKRINELYPALSISFIAYGTDHNAQLMTSLAEETHGSYSIVESLEGAALAMGDALGGIISCVAQNVVVELPEGTTAEGPFKIAGGSLVLGDLYAGSEKLILLSKPEGSVRVRGTALPHMDPFNTEVTTISTDMARNAEIDLTRLRYICADLFSDLRAGTDITERLATFRAALADPFLAGQPVTDMLLAELVSIDAAVAEVGRSHYVSARLAAQLTQHSAYSSTGGGTAQPIQPTVHFADDETEEDPVARGLMDTQSPMAGARQRQIASLMRTMSLQP